MSSSPYDLTYSNSLFKYTMLLVISQSRSLMEVAIFCAFVRRGGKNAAHTLAKHALYDWVGRSAFIINYH